MPLLKTRADWLQQYLKQTLTWSQSQSPLYLVIFMSLKHQLLIIATTLCTEPWQST